LFLNCYIVVVVVVVVVAGGAAVVCYSTADKAVEVGYSAAARQ
jgi:hypothetical protein